MRKAIKYRKEWIKNFPISPLNWYWKGDKKAVESQTVDWHLKKHWETHEELEN